jgi:hypothetical protein
MPLEAHSDARDNEDKLPKAAKPDANAPKGTSEAHGDPLDPKKKRAEMKGN